MTTTIDRRRGRSSRAPGPDRSKRPNGRPRMDPRLRERRTAVLRAQGRHRLRVLGLLVSLPLAVLIGVLVLRSSWLSVRHVTVLGARRTPVAAAERAVAAALHHPMISLDVAALDSDLDALPWVRLATVQRSWPSTLVVRITERDPVAAIRSGPDWAELDGTGRVLALTGSAPAGLPVLSGSVPPAVRPGEVVGAQLRSELAVAAAVPPALRSEVAGMGPEPDGGVQLSLARPKGTTVEIGPATELSDKMAALQTVLAQVDLTGVTVIDIRVPGQPALTRS